MTINDQSIAAQVGKTKNWDTLRLPPVWAVDASSRQNAIKYLHNGIMS